MPISCTKSNGAQSGLTLIEVMISAAILTIISGALLASLVRSQNAYNQGVVDLKVQEATNRIISQITTMIRNSLVVSISDNGCHITLQEPVDYDGDGDVINNNWQVEYGAIWGNTAYLGATCKIIFDVTGSTSESGVESDLNEDGDESDSFSSGVVHLCYYDSTNTLQFTKTISGDLIFVGDVDGNGTVEKMFQRASYAGGVDPTGDSILVKFMVMSIGRDREPYRMRLASQVTPRNR